jgi:mannosyltransferase
MPCLHPDDRWLIDNPALLDLMRRAEAIMTLTDYEGLFLRALDIPAQNIWLIGGGVDPATLHTARRGLRGEFGIPPDESVVLFCGRKEAGKGIQDVVDAMTHVWPSRPTTTLVLAGAATPFSKGRLTSVIAALPPEWKARVISRDDIGEDEKWGWYVECDLLAHPSAIESFGLVYLEAWLAGKPVIAGRTGPQASVVVHGVDGLLVRPGNVKELGAAIERMLCEPGLAAALGQAGRAKVLERYTWDAVVERADIMYRSLVGRHA